MSAASKQKGPLWYGYLEAGDKSTPVIRDERLDTGNGKTMFLFNLARGQILEYNREIVEPKLRELKPSEAAAIGKLDADYGEARRALKHHNVKPLNIPEQGPPPKAAKAAKNADDEDLGDFIPEEADGAWMDSTEEEES